MPKLSKSNDQQEPGGVKDLHIRVGINLVEKITTSGIQGAHQSIHNNISVHVEVLRVRVDVKEPLPIVRWLLFKSFYMKKKTGSTYI